MWRFVCVVSFILMWSAPTEAQTKRAFIVGVEEYASLTDLTRTAEDADGYADVFQNDLGFSVTKLANSPTRSAFNRAFGRFLEDIKPGDEIVFVFSGHGWSDGAENYFAFSDAPRDASEFELKEETVELSRSVLQRIRDRNPSVVVAIVDACRENPFDTGTKSGFEKGLTRVDAPEGTLVIFAAGERQKALDRLSNADTASYSIFTRALLPKLRNGRRPILASVNEARDEVARLASSISHTQRPAVYFDLSLNYCFSGRCDELFEGPSAKPFLAAKPGSADDFSQSVGDGLVYFEFDRYRLNDDNMPTLKKVGKWLEKYSDVRVLIAGRVAEEWVEGRPSREYGLALGERRANSVKEYLVSLGISASRIDTVSFGMERPIDTDIGAEANARNRSAQVLIVRESTLNVPN